MKALALGGGVRQGLPAQGSGVSTVGPQIRMATRFPLGIYPTSVFVTPRRWSGDDASARRIRGPSLRPYFKSAMRRARRGRTVAPGRGAASAPRAEAPGPGGAGG